MIINKHLLPIAFASVLLSSTAQAGLVYEARQQIGDYGLDRHYYTILDEGQMFNEKDATGQINWRDLVFVEIRDRFTGEPKQYPRDGDILVMSERLRLNLNEPISETKTNVAPIPVPGAFWLFAPPVAWLVRRFFQEARL